MLHGIAKASNPLLENSFWTASQASAFRLHSATLAPAQASSSATERPMPRVDPVTRATLPLKSNSDDFT
jgi:hypothetical protein